MKKPFTLTEQFGDVPGNRDDLLQADKLCEEAVSLYSRYILDRIRETGSIKGLAMRCAMPDQAIHSVLDRRGLRETKNLAHEIDRKGFGGQNESM